MNHPVAYKTCGIAQLLQALFLYFFVLDYNTPTWVKIIIIGTTVIIAMSLWIIIGGDDAKMSLFKLLSYIYPVAIGLGISCLMFGEPIPEGSLVSPPDYLKIVRSLFFVGYICLPVFVIFAANALLQFGIKNNGFTVSLALLSSICFGVLFFVPALPQNLICVSFVLSGVAFLLMKSRK